MKKASFIESVKLGTISNIVLLECTVFKLDIEDARNISSMLESMNTKHPSINNILNIINSKIKLYKLNPSNEIRIDYAMACNIIHYIHGYIVLNTPEGRVDDGNVVFGYRAISYERLINAVDHLESRF